LLSNKDAHFFNFSRFMKGQKRQFRVFCSTVFVITTQYSAFYSFVSAFHVKICANREKLKSKIKYLFKSSSLCSNQSNRWPEEVTLKYELTKLSLGSVHTLSYFHHDLNLLNYIAKLKTKKRNKQEPLS
jgi:hypothetical protein